MKKIILSVFTFLFFHLNTFAISDSIKIKELELKIQQLKIENDTLKSKFSNIEKNDYKSLDVIETVNDFYDKSWNKLMIILGFAGSIALIFVPYLQFRNQEKELGLSKRELQDYTDLKLEELETKITEFSNDQYEKLKIEISSLNLNINENLNEEVNYAHAMTFHLRALISGIKKNKNDELKNYINSAYRLMMINRQNDVSSILKSIKKVVIEFEKDNFKISIENKRRLKEFIESVNQKYPENYDEILEILKKYIDTLN